MLKLLILNNLDFLVNIVLFLSLFATSWLHFDSWKLNKEKSFYLVRSIGFLFLAISFLTSATRSNNELFIYISYISKIYGSIAVFWSLVNMKVLKNPTKTTAAAFLLPIMPSLFEINRYLSFLVPLAYLPLIVSLFIRVKKGMEKQLSGLLYSLVFIGIAETLKVFYFWSDSKNVFISNALSNQGQLSLLILAIESIAAFILIKWIWGYIRFRTGVQIFFTNLGLILIIFIFTTLAFTYLLLNNIEDNILDGLKTNAKVALYSIERLQFEAISNSKSIAINSNLITALAEKDRDSLFSITNKFMVDQNLNFLVITDNQGKMITSAEDKEIRNVSFSEDPTFKSAISGKPLSTFYKRDGALAPTIEVRSSAPIFDDNNKIIGSVITGFIIDNPLLDGIKELTDMEITIYGDNIRSASTINLAQEKTRYIGVVDNNSDISDSVIGKGSIWMGTMTIVNRPYYLVYLPLKNYEGKTIGMISVAKPQSILTKLSEKSIQTTFFISVALLVLSIAPSYFVSKNIEENITA